MNSGEVKAMKAEKCPLCGKGNDCQRCASDTYKGPCWCFKVDVPEELIARVPEDLRGKACICRDCVMDFHQRKAGAAMVVEPGDFYFENGLIVFTAAYHKRRGYCCGSRCRHCPYTADNRRC